MPQWNLQETVSSGTILLMHQFWFPNWRPFSPELDYSSFCQASCSCCGYSSAPKHFTPQCSLCITQNCWLLWQEGPQRWSGAKPSFHLRGTSGPEKWSDKKVLVVKLGTTNQALPLILCSCQKIKTQVPQVPLPPWVLRLLQEPGGRRRLRGDPPEQLQFICFIY